MAHIIERRRADGSIGFTAQIRIRRKGVTYQESETFDRRSQAAGWAEKRENELAKPGAIADALRRRDPTLGQVIDHYIGEMEATLGRPLGRSKKDTLNAVKKSSLAAKRCSQLVAQDYVDHFRDRIVLEGVKPQTNSNAVAYLGQIAGIAAPAWGFPLAEAEFLAARKVMRKMKLTSKTRERDRRPTLPEIDKLMALFWESQLRRVDSIPMAGITAFGIFSTRRESEICRITWPDYDGKRGCVIVRNMKNPGETHGNDVEVDLPPEAVAIIEAMRARRRGGDDRIFPHNAGSVSSRFTDACKLLGIVDLRFHDLRHEGVSWLFEMGWELARVAKVSGHRDWNSLRRYTHLKGRGDKYADWPWRARLGIAAAGEPS